MKLNCRRGEKNGTTETGRIEESANLITGVFTVSPARSLACSLGLRLQKVKLKLSMPWEPGAFILPSTRLESLKESLSPSLSFAAAAASSSSTRLD